MSLLSQLRLYVRRQASSPGRYLLEQALVESLGWLPTIAGIGIRALAYRLILKMHGFAAIETGVRIRFASHVELNHGAYLDQSVYLHACPNGTLAECDAIIAAVKRNRVHLQIGFMRRFDPEFSAAALRVIAGEIGRLMLIKSLTHGPGLPPPWARDLKTSNGMLAEVNSHDWDTLRWLMGSNYEKVYTEVANFKGPANQIDTPDFYDTALVNIRFESGALGSITGVCPCGYGYDARVEIVGEKGILHIGGLQGQALVQCTDRDTGLVTPIHRTWAERFGWAYIYEMVRMARLVECVPNFSEGRDRGVIDAIAQALASVSGVKLLDVDPGADTNRTVYTLVGPPDGVAEAAFRGGVKAAQLIDMTAHKGAHPRMGALDDCPFIPVADITMAECAELAKAVGRRIGYELQIPVYFYEHAAASEERRSLANIRAGEYEGLAAKLEEPAWRATALGWGLSHAHEPNVLCPDPMLFRLGYDDRWLYLCLACY